jgi:hypothetical protein
MTPYQKDVKSYNRIWLARKNSTDTIGQAMANKAEEMI